MTSFIRPLATLLACTLLFSACKKKETPEPTPPSPLPVVSTAAISSIATDQATGGGQVSSEGSSALTDVGICWDTDHNPTTLRPHASAGAGTGSFQRPVTGLTPNTTYYVRAYASNASGTAYGSEVSFKTLSAWSFVGNVPGNGGTFLNTLIAKGNLLVGATNLGNILTSGDEGITWQTATSNGLPSFSTIFLAAHKGFLFAAIAGNGVYASSDNGNNWFKTSNGINSTYITSLVAGESALYATTADDGIYMSSNSGVNWTTINTNLSELYITGLAVSGQVLLAKTQTQGLCVSANNGGSWAAANGGLSNLNVYGLGISGSKMLVSCANGNFISADNGSSWQPMNGIASAAPCFFLVEGNTVLNVRPIPNGTDVFLSFDNGTSWAPIQQGLNSVVVSSAMSSNSMYASSFSNPARFYKRPLR